MRFIPRPSGKTTTESTHHIDLPSFENLAATVLGVSAASLAALPWLFDRNEKVLNKWQRKWIFWIDVALMLAAPLSLLALQTMTFTPKLARCCGFASILCFIVALALLLSFFLLWLVSSFPL